MTGTGFKIPPVVLAVFIAGELAMFGGGYLLGSALASGDGEGEPKATSDNPSPGGEEDEMRRQIQSLQEDLKASGERVTELDTKLKQAHLDIKEANRRAIESGEASFADNRHRDAAAAEMNSKLDALNLELMREKQRYAELEAIAFPGKPKLVYGQWADLKELRTSNWDEAGAAADSMVKDSLKRFYDHLMSGKDWSDLDPELMEKVQNENLKLIELAGRFNKKVPTHATNVNGSFAHPVLQFNLLAAALAKSGHPLSERQLEDLVRAGEQYDAKYEAAQKGYTPSTLALVKLLDELELKLEASAVLDATLTPEQHKAAFPDGMRHVSHFDIYSPTLMLATHGGAVPGVSREAVKQLLIFESAKNLGFDAVALDTHSAVFDTFLTDCSSLLTPMPAMQASMIYTGQECLLAGRAQVRMIESLVSLLRPGDEIMEKIRKASGIAIPRIIKAEEGK